MRGTLEYPLEALREAVPNALCHREYRDPGNVQVCIFDDRLEVWNPGLLPSNTSRPTGASRTGNMWCSRMWLARPPHVISPILLQKVLSSNTDGDGVATLRWYEHIMTSV